MTELHITRGLPRSGKTTFALDWLSQDIKRRRVNRDELRHLLFGKYWGETPDEVAVIEPAVTKVQHSLIRSNLKAGHDTIVDDTNLNAKNVKELLKIAAELGVTVVWHDKFLDVPVATLLERDAASTERQVGASVIMDFYRRYLSSGKLPKRPQLDATPLPTTARYEGTPGKPKAFLVDLDGTIASNGPDREHPNRGYFDWHRVGEDLPIKRVIEIVRMFEGSGLMPLFVSGRDGSCYQQTQRWIHEHVYEKSPAFDFIWLYMRPEGDIRKDSIVKLEIFDNEIRDNWDVQFCLDDRNQVVDAYRSIGLTVLQVADGNF